MRIDFDFKDLSRWENFYRFFKAVYELKMVGACLLYTSDAADE